MPEPVLIALIIGIGGPAILFALNRQFGGKRKDTLAEWQGWAEEQGKRIERLESRVGALEKALDEERAENERLTHQNTRQASMLTALVRWAILLRDEVIRRDGKVPPAPVEVEAAMTTLDP